MTELLKLIFCFFKIGFLSFGGGYSVLPLIEEYTVIENHWLTYEQYTDIITISEITPGPISINAASFTGYAVHGFIGAVAATVGCILPSVIIVSALAVLYIKYRNAKTLDSVLSMLRPAVCAVIFTSFITIGLLSFFGVSEVSEITYGNLNLISIAIFAAASVILITKKANPILVIICSGLAGLLLY